ncbi:hypothetical protein HKD37_14G040117 [Glycine soja]
MPSSFADLVFARERIEVGLKRGKFDYVSSTSTNARRIGATGAKRKEGDTHAVTSVPAWIKPPQTFHGTHQSTSLPSQSGITLRHSTEKCLALKYKVQHLIDAGWLKFQEDRPNVKTNPLANHGEGAVNAVESGRPRRSKPLKDVMTPKRFIFEALQKGGVIPHGGHREDSCLMHPGKLHNMETCLAVEDLLQQMIDRGRLEVGNEGSEEQHIFKPIPFPYQNSHTVTWRYAPPSERKEEATDISSLSAKVTNIMGLSSVTRSGHVFAPPDLPTQPTNAKGKAKIAEEQNDKAIPAPDEDIPMKSPSEKKDGCGKKEVSLEEAGEFLRIIQQSEFKVIEQLNKTPTRVSFLELLMRFEPHRALLVKVVSIASVDSSSGQPCLFDMAMMVARVMLGNGYEPGMGLGKNNDGRTSLISTRGNCGKFGLGYKPTQANIRESVAGRKSESQGSQLGRKVEGGPPYHISRSFISAGLGHEGQVVAICEDDSPSGSDMVRPCPPGFRLGNWRVEECPDIYATSIISDDESLEGTNTWDPTIDFKQETDQTESEEDEDVGLPPELEKIVTHEDQEMGPHQEETELVDLGIGSGKKEVKIGTGMTHP